MGLADTELQQFFEPNGKPSKRVLDLSLIQMQRDAPQKLQNSPEEAVMDKSILPSTHERRRAARARARVCGS
jgi:hypothetical protein